jgi:hypothetical protein
VQEAIISPRRLKIMDRELVVPWSKANMYFSGMSAFPHRFERVRTGRMMRSLDVILPKISNPMRTDGLPFISYGTSLGHS